MLPVEITRDHGMMPVPNPMAEPERYGNPRGGSSCSLMS